MTEQERMYDSNKTVGITIDSVTPLNYTDWLHSMEQIAW